MYKGLGVLQRDVDALYDVVFAQHYLVPQRHKLILHVGLYACDEVYAIVEEVVEKSLRDVSPVSEEPAVQVLCRHFPHLRVAVVGVGRSEAESDNFHLVVADELQLEPVAPSHRSFVIGSKTIEDLVHVSPYVVADGHHGGVYVAHAVAPAEILLSDMTALRWRRFFPEAERSFFLNLGVKILAEFVHSTENLSNFVVDDHKSVFNILVFSNKIQNFL